MRLRLMARTLSLWLTPGSRQKARAAGQRESAERRSQTLPAFPYPLERVAGSHAFRRWEEIKVAGVGWPIILGAEAEFTDFGLGANDRRLQIESDLDLARKVEFPSDMRARWAREHADEDGAPPPLPRGAWPERSMGSTLSIIEGVKAGRKYIHDKVLITTLPTSDWTEAPAFLGLGGWNECPDASTQIAAFRYWRARHGVELVGVGNDFFDLRAARRPETREEAIALAEEQFYFCPDIVYQGAETIDVLAGELMASDWWCFWWD